MRRLPFEAHELSEGRLDSKGEHMKIHNYCLLSLFCAIAANARAETTPNEQSLTFVYENDVFNGNDNGYTDGVRFAWTSPENDLPLPVDLAVDNLIGPAAEWFPLFPSDGRRRITYAFGQSMFTPEHIEARALIPNDRPYAGWLYGSAGIISDTGAAYDNLELTIGIVGPASLAEPMQKFVHKHITNSPTPKGWDNQLGNEPGVVLSYEHKWRKLYESTALGFGVDFVPHVSASLGNVFTLAAAGGTIRFGQNLPDSYGTPRVRPSIGGSDYFSSDHDFGWYFFAGAEGRAVARNIFLDGNTFTDSHSVDKKYLVGDVQGGISVFYRNMRMSFTTVWRSDEFRRQPENERFGVLSLTVNY